MIPKHNIYGENKKKNSRSHKRVAKTYIICDSVVVHLPSVNTLQLSNDFDSNQPSSFYFSPRNLQMTIENPLSTPQSDSPPPYEQVVTVLDDELPPSYDAIFPPEVGHQVSLVPLQVIQECGVQTENNGSRRETFLQTATNHIWSSCVGNQIPCPDRFSRKEFVRNVYGIVSFQLLIMIFVVLVSNKLIYSNIVYYGLSVLAFPYFIYSCCYFMSKKLTPLENTVCLPVQTLSIGVLLGMLPKAKTVLLSVEISAFTCVSLTVFATISSTTGGFLLVIGIIAVVFSFTMLTLPGAFSLLHLGYACLGAMIFSTYLVYDVQLMVMGKHSVSASISWEDYMYGVSLFNGDLFRKIIIMIQFLLTLIMVIRGLSGF